MIGMLMQGGWPMIPLGVCSIVGLTIAVERFIALRRASVIDPGILDLVERFDENASVENAVLACRRAHGAFARIIESILKARQLDQTQIIERMHATGRTQIGLLERGLTVLEIVAGVSPLLGLLGTVLGMVTVFNAITVHGLGNPQVLSDGISKALITTVVGLCVAIPALASHSWLSRQVDDLAIEMEDHATAFAAKLQLIRRRQAAKSR
jgi:biopolymer transport protein ExbB